MTPPILVTGGTGFVGKHLIALLQRQESQIAVLSSTKEEHPETGVRYYQVDVRNRDGVQAVVRDVAPRLIYHLAGISSVGSAWENPRLTYEVNLLGAYNVLDAAMHLPVPARILNVSTAQVYARSSLPLTEKSPLAPDNPYSASKAMSELLRIEFKDYSSGGVITARAFNHTGPGQTPDFVLPSIARQFAEIQAGLQPAKLVLGNVGVKRDFTDVRDVAAAYTTLLNNGVPGEIYNVCSGVSVRLAEIVRLFEEECNLKIEIQTDPSKLRGDEADEICGNPEKIRAETGWFPQIPLGKMIADLMDYWRRRTAGSPTNSR
ncbi:MAG: GDP-mannose 4,6-dehydratase [Terriglobales bacterium]